MRSRAHRSDLNRWGGVAVLLGGAFLVAKGVVIILSDADPSFVPPATFLFALGMVGLHARLDEHSGLLGRIGVLLAWVAVVASAVNLIALVLGVTPEQPPLPILLRVTYMVAFLGILIGLFLLGIAVLRAKDMSPRRNVVPLAVGILWFPLQGIGFVISDGVGLVLGGLAWMLLGYILWSENGGQARHPVSAG
jgi:hypothetical protein